MAKGRGGVRRGAARGSAAADDGGGEAGAEPDPRTDRSQWKVIYRPVGMRLARALVRTKVLQLAGVGALAPLVCYGGSLSAAELGACVGIVGGSGAATACLLYFQRRYAGEVSKHKHAPVMRFSVLDFWGSRQEVCALSEHVRPPFAGASKEQLRDALARGGLVRIRVDEDEDGTEREFMLAPRMRKTW